MKNAIVAIARIPDPISDWIGLATKLFATTPAATAMKIDVVYG